ncbi:putative peptide synthetase [Methanocella paludicola SANAE]|uniref:Peptide synthetase n=1 Tax=Methanocella paludicola (strain DSM 17711 / JCM 13418 / NBRC 101707 / SANAE) TaxID=304371 RepID=D1YV33_METPS|nr:non-ribosomal peptide synthetase [Methanocella paludicola]BAI60305.1 putative peptide synthetase [Methanocella paludicola SANAE]
MDERQRIKPRVKDGPILASFAQQRMWFLEQMDPDNAIYNQLNALLIRGQPDIGVLGRCLDEVMRRHEALRTNLIIENGQVLQHISPPKALDLHIVDLSGLSPVEAMAEAERLAVVEAKRPFDLGNEPLIRARLFKLSDGEHLLTFVTHHAIFDGWSVNIFMSELAVLYGAVRESRPLPPEPALQYADYAVWQRERYDRGDFDEQLRYWQDKLGGDLPFLELPADRPCPPAQSFDGAVYTCDIPGDVADALKALARSERATLFMVLLAAYNVLLYRHTGQNDIVVGCPIAGRHYLEIEDNIGLFVNTLPMRNRLSGDMPFIELARSVRKTALEAYSNQDIPFDKLVETLPLDRQPSRPPVFQTLFQMRNFPGRDIMVSDIFFERHFFNYSTAKVDLTFEVTETKAGLSCRLVYPVAIFDERTIALLADHWLVLLRSIVQDPGQPIGRLAMLTPGERRLIVHEWNDTKADYPVKAVSRIFEERARASPDTVAVAHDNERLTYEELNARANRLARHMDISPGATVVIYMERSIEMVICELAVLKAGGVYVPVDPSDPRPRTELMLKDSHAGLILVKTPPSGLQLPDECRMICLEAEREAIGLLQDGNLAVSPSVKSTAYIMYTSGSTGQPKGVRVPHRGICRLVINTNYVHMSPGDTVAHISNPAFDASTFEVWGALLNGARLAIFDRDTVLTPDMFAAHIAEEHVDTLFVTAQLFNLYSREAPGAFKSVRDLLVGGDVVEPTPVKRVLEHGRPRRLLNAYGPTENTTFSTWYLIREPVENSIPIGRPISNTTAYVLDEYLEPVPVGVTGEIYLGGDGVSQGYHGRPDLNASAFVPDPFCSGSMLYRTGDLGRYLPDGNIRFLGRRDSQVKIRGFRVEAGEVNALLGAHPSVKASLIAVNEVRGERQLVAYVVPLDGRGIEEGDLREHMRAKLPEYMIPVAFIPIETIPLTPTGKVDYLALPVPGDLSHGNGGELRDELEYELAEIWEDVLGIDNAGTDDNFFGLGGHSLKAITLCARIGEKLHVKLPVNTIFLAPTIGRMARAIRELKTFNPPLLIKNGPVRPPLFCIIAIGGTLAEYAPMAAEFEKGRQVYALQMPWHDEGLVPGSIEELARRLIEDVKAVQPHGPYNLLGYCAGGAVAYEMAARLRSAGEEIGFLGLIDLVPPGYHYRLDSRSLKILAGRFPIVLSNIALAPPGQRLARIWGIPAMAGQFLSNLAHREPGDGSRAARSYPEWLMAMPGPYHETTLAAFEIYKKYVFRPYAGDVVLFFSRKTADNFKDALYAGPALGWEKYVDGALKVHVVPGDHETMTRPPSAKELARAVEEYLATDKSPGGGAT